MTYPVAAGPARQRPGTVTVAVYLMYLTAALQVVSLVIGLLVLGDLQSGLDRALEGSPGAETAKTATVIGTVVGLAIGGLFAVGWTVLAVLNGQGRNPARIVTWVLGGLAICCGTAALAGNAAGSLIPESDPAAGAPSQAEITRIVNETLPSWYPGLSTTLTVVGLLVALAVVILLALPASNAFFRKAEPAWEPPTM